MPEIDRVLREKLYSLYARYYAAADRETFERDLNGKDSAFLVWDGDQLAGFSTLQVSRTLLDGAPIRVAYSGDTIIERAYWGSTAFSFAWVRHMGRLAAQEDAPLFWLLIVKGWRTYRYLATFGLEFVPDWRKPDHPSLARLRDALALSQFGAAYDCSAGLVRYSNSQGHLASPWAVPSEREARRPDVEFFLSRNPGYVRGDELVCLIELSSANMRPLTRRLFEQGTAK